MVSRVAFWARFGDRYKRLGVDWRGRVMGMNVAPIIQSFEREKNTLLNRSHAIKVESVGDELDQKWTPVFIWSMSLQEMEKAGVQGQQTNSKKMNNLNDIGGKKNALIILEIGRAHV